MVGLKLKDKQELDRRRIFLTEEAYTLQHLLMVKDGGSWELGAWGLRKKQGLTTNGLGCFAKEFNILLKAMGSYTGIFKVGEYHDHIVIFTLEKSLGVF